MRKLSFIIRLALLTAALSLDLLLASCGGGGSALASIGGGVGTGGTGISLGTVTGFGSVVVDGTAYDSATPNYYAETDTAESAPTSATTVELGAQLSIALDAQGNPTTVTIDPELVGAVAGLGAGAFTVNGVPVRINTNPAAGPVTYYAGLSGFSGLTAGMQVEVHGAVGIDSTGQGYVQATLIEQLPASNPVTRITGPVSNLDPAAGTFRIGGSTILTTSATSVSPAGLPLADGQIVNVWSNTAAAANGAVTAQDIGIRSLLGAAGPVQIGGLVAQRQGASFLVSGIPIDASAAGLASTVAGLVNGEYVVVQGRSDASTGTVAATAIRPYSAQPAQVELKGTITGFVSQGNFLVRGVPVDASQAQFAGGAATSLANGVFVDIVGSVSSSNLVTASRVTVLPSVPDGGTVDYQGKVSGLVATPGGTTSFTLTYRDDGRTSTAQVTLAPNVVFSRGTAAQLVNGSTVEIEAVSGANGLTAYSVTFQNVNAGTGSGESATTSETRGIVYDYVKDTSFSVNGITIQMNGVQPSGGALADGLTVEVSFTQSGGSNLAKEISLD